MPTPEPQIIHIDVPPSLRLREKWLRELLPNVAFDGWTEPTARAAAEAIGLTEAEQALAAPGGINDLIETFFDLAEQKLAEELKIYPLDQLGVRERVGLALRIWLRILKPDREAVRRAAGRGFLPWHAGAATRRAWSVADTIWTVTGDTSEDYNRYTKRGLLAAIIPPLVLYWLDEDDEQKLEAYIERHLNRAMKIGQAGGKAFGPILSMFSRQR